MDPVSIAQILNPFLQTVFIVVIGLGYYYTTKAIRSQVDEMARQATTGGRPLIIVSEDYENLPTTNLIIQNVGPGPAKNIDFHFSSPIESSDGFVLSELTLFQEGITSLAPGARIVCYWDELENLQPLIRDGSLQRNATVTVEYQDIAGGQLLPRLGGRPRTVRGPADPGVQEHGRPGERRRASRGGDRRGRGSEEPRGVAGFREDIF